METQDKLIYAVAITGGILFIVAVFLLLWTAYTTNQAHNQACENIGYTQYSFDNAQGYCVKGNQADMVAISCTNEFTPTCKAYIINNYKEDK